MEGGGRKGGMWEGKDDLEGGKRISRHTKSHAM
jgi:hypothetical protein